MDREHSFTGLEKDLDMDESEVEMANKAAARAKELLGPVYTTDQKEQINHFKEVVMHAEMIRNLQVRFSFFELTIVCKNMVINAVDYLFS